MRRLKIKVCGVTTKDAIDACVSAEVDAIGFVFAESPRRLSLDKAPGIVELVPAPVARVAVFRRPSMEHIKSVLDAACFTHVQCDVEDVPTFAAMNCRVPILPVVRTETPSFDKLMLGEYKPVSCLVEGPKSGAGETVDWNAVAMVVRNSRVFLAGGLTPQNVAEACKIVKPFGVDVSSGVESSPGVKDLKKIAAFIAAARAVEKDLT